MDTLIECSRDGAAASAAVVVVVVVVVVVIVVVLVVVVIVVVGIPFGVIRSSTKVGGGTGKIGMAPAQG